MKKVDLKYDDWVTFPIIISNSSEGDFQKQDGISRVMPLDSDVNFCVKE